MKQTQKLELEEALQAEVDKTVADAREQGADPVTHLRESLVHVEVYRELIEAALRYFGVPISTNLSACTSAKVSEALLVIRRETAEQGYHPAETAGVLVKAGVGLLAGSYGPKVAQLWFSKISQIWKTELTEAQNAANLH